MEKALKKITQLVLLSILFLVIQSCNSKNDKEGEKTTQKEMAMADLKNDTAANLAAGAPDDPVFKLPFFEVARPEVEKYFGAGKKNPKKFLVRVEFGDITELDGNGSKLLLYPAKNHSEFAAKQSPLEVPAGEGFSGDMNSNVIIGNVEFDASILLESNGTLKAFELLRFKPQLVKGDDKRENHLAFKIYLVSPQKDEQEIGDANPSPPKTPTQN